MKKKLGILSALALAFAGCGDSSSEEPSEMDFKIPEVDSFEDLVHCTKSHYGELVKVLDLDSIYECTSEDWVVADSSSIEDALSKSSSSLEKGASSSSVKASADDTKKIENKKVESVKVSGYAQKGPFVDGTTVNIYGLDDKLEETKVKFSGKTSGDSGHFSIKDITLDNQYALIEVSGFFENLMTWKATSGTRTKLHAIVDLSAGKSVNANVNLFTELEYERVKQLVLNEKYNVPAAKKHATAEILGLFDVKGSKDLTVTSVSLADTGSAGASLYAFAVMMIADLSTSKFGNRLDDFNEDFAQDGSWDDAEMRANVADFLSTYAGADSVRTRAKALKVSNKLPDFEKILREFWTNELGLGKCTDSMETTIKKVSNKESEQYGSGFACTSKRWHKTSELDTELGLCVTKREGEFKESKLKKSTTYFTCSSGEWKEISKTAYELKSCTSKRENEYVKAESGEMFVCLDKQWKELDDVTYELKLCTESRNEKVEKTKAGKYYACYNEEWQEVEEVDFKIGYPCVEKGLNNREELDGKYYRCDGKKWAKISKDMFEIGLCKAIYVGICEQGVSGKYYHCVEDDGEYVWEDYDMASCEIGECDESMKDSTVVLEGVGYYCNGKNWKTCDASNANELIDDFACVDSLEYDNRYYAWRKALEKEKIAGGVCSANFEISSEDNDDKWVYYNNDSEAIYCINYCNYEQCMMGVSEYSWVQASEENLKTGMLCQSGTVNVLKNGYVCEALGARDFEWRKAETVELKLNKVCEYNIRYTVEGEYACDYNEDGQMQWRKATGFEKESGAVCEKSRKGKTITSAKSNKFTCRANTVGSKFYWVKVIGGKEAIEIGSQVWRNSNETYGGKARSDDASGKKYGTFYTFNAAQNICSGNWRLPTKDDVNELKNFFGGNKTKIAAALLDSSNWYVEDAKGNFVEVVGTNDFGFSASQTGIFYDCSDIKESYKGMVCGGEDYMERNGQYSVAFYFWTSDGGTGYGYYGSIDHLGEIQINKSNLSPVYLTNGVQSVPHLLPVRCILRE